MDDQLGNVGRANREYIIFAFDLGPFNGSVLSRIGSRGQRTTIIGVTSLRGGEWVVLERQPPLEPNIRGTIILFFASISFTRFH
jgi:hypothetical protein